MSTILKHNDELNQSSDKGEHLVLAGMVEDCCLIGRQDTL